MSTFDKRKKYIVPVVKSKKKNITVIEDQEKNKKNENELDENSKEIKELLTSKLIENKQIELLKDYQKYMDDCNDKIYKSNEKKPQCNKADYLGLASKKAYKGSKKNKRHVSDYYLHDLETDMHYLIELKIGGDLDNKKARSEKEALLEQYCILCNTLGSEDKVKICFATAYNRFGEGMPWTQGRVLQFFAKDELLISADFWNLVCKSAKGYEIVLDAYKEYAPLIVDALNDIKDAYLPND